MTEKEPTPDEIDRQLADFDAELAEITARQEASRQRVKQLDAEGRAERAQIGRKKKPERPSPNVSHLDEISATADALIRRSKELSQSQRRILDELAANPLEKNIDSVFAQMGRKLYSLVRGEVDEAAEANRLLKEDEQSDEFDDQLERSGQPPPLRRG